MLGWSWLHPPVLAASDFWGAVAFVAPPRVAAWWQAVSITTCKHKMQSLRVETNGFAPSSSSLPKVVFGRGGLSHFCGARADEGALHALKLIRYAVLAIAPHMPAPVGPEAPRPPPFTPGGDRPGGQSKTSCFKDLLCLSSTWWLGTL